MGGRGWETSEEATALILEEKMGTEVKAVALMEGDRWIWGTLRRGAADLSL